MNQKEQKEFNIEQLVERFVWLIEAIVDDKVTFAHTDLGNYPIVDERKKDLIIALNEMI